MKTVVKIDPEKEYFSAKSIIEALTEKSNFGPDLSSLGSAVDNLKTVINVLIERATPKKKPKPPKSGRAKKKSDKNLPKDFNKLPSEKFPDLEIEEKVIKADSPPLCPCCQKEMSESGLHKTSEKLEVTPKKYHIIRNKRVIYNCRACHGGLVNAPSAPAISRNSNYGDSLIIDVALSKYLDLIPIDRYCAMADRQGLRDLPPNSMVSLTHTLTHFLLAIYGKIKQEVLSSKIIFADETPHKMLEGDDTPNWYLWGFSSDKATYFEVHGTRSGEIPLNFLLESSAEYLLTDGYSGYKRAIRDLLSLGRDVSEVYCNAHSYRYFRDAATTWESECQLFLELYGKIYDLERQVKTEEEKKHARRQMQPLFQQMKLAGEKEKNNVMAGSSFEKAINYFLNHYLGLTKCLNNIDLPLDNNFSERILRSYVVGRKTWLGTHSKRGAQTNATLFSIVESCKINNVNARNYLPWIVQCIHQKKEILTPYEYSQSIVSG